MPKPIIARVVYPSGVSAADAIPLERSFERTIDECYAAGQRRADPPVPVLDVTSTFDARMIPEMQRQLQQAATIAYREGWKDGER